MLAAGALPVVLAVATVVARRWRGRGWWPVVAVAAGLVIVGSAAAISIVAVANLDAT